MLTHLLSEGEVDEKFMGVSMSRKCYEHMDAVLASRADVKPSKASGVFQVWANHFKQYCQFWTPMTDEELCTV